MSYFDKKRKYTEIYSKTERSRGYLEEKVVTLIDFNELNFCLFRLTLKRLISINF